VQRRRSSDKLTVGSMLRSTLLIAHGRRLPFASSRYCRTGGCTHHGAVEMGETLAVCIDEVAAVLLIMARCRDERDNCHLHQGGRGPSTRHGTVEMARRWPFSAYVGCVTCVLCVGRTFGSKSIRGRSRVVDQKRQQRRWEIVLKACCLLVTHQHQYGPVW
jgi:hypothetical protein